MRGGVQGCARVDTFGCGRGCKKRCVDSASAVDVF